jgi:hypothetical protein
MRTAHLATGMTIVFDRPRRGLACPLVIDHISTLGTLTSVWVHDPMSAASGEAVCAVLIVDDSDTFRIVHR